MLSRFKVSIWLGLMFVFLPLGLARAQTQAVAHKIDPQVFTDLSQDGKVTFFVVLREQMNASHAVTIRDRKIRGEAVVDSLKETAARTQAPIVDFLARAKAEVTTYWIVNTIKVTTHDERLIQDLAAFPNVALIKADETWQIPEPIPGAQEPTIQAVEWGVARVRAPEVWTQFNVRGEGIVVANIDTGVQFNHPALVSQYRGLQSGGTFDHNYNWHDPSRICGSPSLIPCDNNGHGTHTMGTAVGDDGGTNQIGVAPGAKWIAAKGCESNSCSLSALLSSGQWVLAPTDLNGQNPRPDLRPHIVNNSWGGGGGSTFYQATVQAWRNAGIFPAFSIGNGGSSCGTAGSPGDYPESFGVGAIDIFDNIAGFSSRGPANGFGGIVKPNVSAPGVSVRSSVPTNSYASLSGTSMAAPHVAGVVALLWAAMPELVGDIAGTEDILQRTAQFRGSTQCGSEGPPNNVYGWGIVDSLAAVQDSTATVTITATDPNAAEAGPDPGTFTVSRTGSTGSSLTVFYAVGGSATNGTDYQNLSGSVTVPAGSSTAPITVNPIDDSLIEGDENVVVQLQVNAAYNLGDPNSATVTIADNDKPTVAFNAASSSDLESVSSANLPVSLSSVSGQTVTVDYAVSGGTATGGGVDYTLTNGTLTFNPGEITKNISITIVNDSLDEAHETIQVTLSNPTNAALGATTVHTYTINDDDATPTVTLGLSGSPMAEAGGVATVAATLSAVSGQNVTVNLAFSGTATLTSDYTRSGTSISIPAGSLSGSITLTAVQDSIDEANETIIVDIETVVNATESGTQQVTAIITDDDAVPAVAFDASSSSGAESVTPANLAISLSAASGQTVTVNYAVTGGTASGGGVDYTFTNGTLSFSPGETTKNIQITVVNDTLDEENETIQVTLSSPVNATLGATTQHTYTVTDDDTAPSLSINDVAVTEGDAGTVNAVFTVSLSAASGQTVTVQFATADGTATAGSDYVAVPLTTLTFNPGETSKTVTVQVNGDTLPESNETFFVNLSNASNATISDSQGLGTINNDDPLPSLSINDVAGNEGNSGTNIFNFTVTLSSASAQAVTVQYATADGTATGGPACGSGIDYVSTSGTASLTIPAGATTGQIPVAVCGDTVVEPNETFFVNLSGATNATISDGQGQGTIANDDLTTVTIVATDPTATEANTTTGFFTVSRTGSTASSLTVFYQPGGSATAGSDYQTLPGSVVIPAGQSTATITVTPIDDSVVGEGDETVLVQLQVNAAYDLGNPNIAMVTITDNDKPFVSINDVTVDPEGHSGTVNADFTVSLSAASGQTVTVNFATANGTAKAGSNYVAKSGTLTFNPGEISKTISVAVKGDTLDEANETFFINLSAPINAILGKKKGIGTIVDDDPPPSLSINNVTVTEGNTGTLNAVFKVSLSEPSGQTVTVKFATANGTAAAGSDYVAKSGTLSLSPGQTTKDITIAVKGDTVPEPNETFFVNLSNAINANIADNQGVGTIIDND